MNLMYSMILVASTSLASSWGLAAPGERSPLAASAVAAGPPPAAADTTFDAIVRAHYLAHPHDYDEYELSHIFIRVRGASPVPGEKSMKLPDAMSLARRLKARLRGGEAFATVAAVYSDDDATRVDGGRLPSMFRINMLPVFEHDVPTLAPGRISGPLRGEQGIHLVRVEAVHRVDSARAKRFVAVQLREEGQDAQHAVGGALPP